MGFFAKLDPRGMLRHAAVYNLHSKIVAPHSRKQSFVDTILKPCEGERVLDIGCGTAPLLRFMPAVDYIGFDLSLGYVETARATYAGRAAFHQRALTEDAARDLPSFDLAMAMGVLHHLDDDEAQTLFRVAHGALKPSGRLVTCDGAYVAGQSLTAKLLLDMDRGRHVRAPQAYRQLAERAFPLVEVAVHHDLNAFPYTHCVMTCRRPA